MAKNKSTFYFLIIFVFLISAISYRYYFKYSAYAMDDYETFTFAPAETSVFQACKVTSDVLYSVQKRFQPVRLCLFVALTRFFEEESSAYYNFALHLVNIALLFFLLRKFGAGSIFSLISILLFAVFGRSRYMDSSSAMIGGSGLNLFFISTTFLFLIKSLEAHGRKLVRRYFFLAISLLAYSALVFSYEVAAPLFAPLMAVFYLFCASGEKHLSLFKRKKIYYLFLYLIPLLIYIIFFRLLIDVDYEGARIVWSANIFLRLKSYLLYTLFPPFRLSMPSVSGLIILLLYFFAVILGWKRGKTGISLSDRKKTGLKVLLFSLIFYPATLILFVINDWLTPDEVMVHHTYLMTAAGSILIVSFFYNLQWLLPSVLRGKFIAILVIFFSPIILLNAESNMVSHYGSELRRVNTSAQRAIKKGLQGAVPEVVEIDAIILKNFYSPYYDIHSVNGALSKWFGFKKYLISGREIISVRGDDIVFKGPLSRYEEPGEVRVKNNRVRMFFVSPGGGEILPYHYFIDFRRGLNLYQTLMVKKDCMKEGCNDSHVLEAILSSFKGDKYIKIWFKSSMALQAFLNTSPVIEVNDERVTSKRVSVSGRELSIDVSEIRERINYFFLKIISDDDKFKSYISLTAMDSAGG